MLALTGWTWAGCGVAALMAIVALLFGARRSWRTSVRQELVDHLRRTAPELAITAIHPDRLELAMPGAAPDAGATFYLARLYQRIAELPAGDTPELRAGRAAVYDTIVATIRDGATGLESLDAEAERANVMPRLLTDGRWRDARQVGAGRALPSLPSGVAGLSIVFVLDREASVAYLTGELLAELKLTPESGAGCRARQPRPDLRPRRGPVRGRVPQHQRHQEPRLLRRGAAPARARLPRCRGVAGRR